MAHVCLDTDAHVSHALVRTTNTIRLHSANHAPPRFVGDLCPQESFLEVARLDGRMLADALARQATAGVGWSGLERNQGILSCFAGLACHLRHG